MNSVLQSGRDVLLIITRLVSTNQEATFHKHIHSCAVFRHRRREMFDSEKYIVDEEPMGLH